MKKSFWALVALFIVILIAGAILVFLPSNKVVAPTYTNGNNATTTTQTPAPTGIADLITVDTPLPGATIASPLTIAGSARGNWYFEASFPVVLKDASGKVIAQAPAKAQGDWMTTDFVSFSLSLTYPAQPKGSHGTLVLKNDNPSGDPAKDKSVEIPVVF